MGNTPLTMASSLSQIFHRLWQNIDETVSHLLETQHPEEQICEQLRWLSNNIDAEWTHLTFNADNQLRGIQERGAELSQDAPCQPVRSLDLAMKSNYKANANSRSLDDAR